MSQKPAPKILIKSHEKRLVFAEVYSPLQVDTDSEAMTPDEIEKMAHNFLSKGRINKIDVQHSFKESGCVVVESFIARKHDPDGFINGAWVLGVKVIPDELWAKVLKGELNCFSFGGQGQTQKAKVKVTQITKMIGETEPSLEDGPLPIHSHPFEVDFDDGVVVPGRTEVFMDHFHKIQKASSTMKELDHSHRIIVIEQKE